MTTRERLETTRHKLLQLQASDTGLSVFGASNHQYELKPVLSQPDVEAFEQKFQVTLPLEYRLFLTEIANGGAGPCYGLYSLEKGVEEAIRASSEENTPVPNAFAVNFPMSTQTTAEFMRYYQECIDEGDDDQIVYPQVQDPFVGTIFLADYGCGWSYVLVVKGEQAGTVWLHGEHLSPVFDKDKQWSFLDWYENWLDRSIEELSPVKKKVELGSGNTIINYDGWQLKTIPTEVFTNKGLKKLVLSRNDLRKFPLEILQLTELRTLDLSMTPIVEIPERIAELTKLKRLRLSYNYHRNLPSSLARLQELEELSMTYNYKLKEVPEVVGKITSLKKLHFGYCNELKGIHENIGDLARLEILYLNDTALSSLPESMGRLVNLRHLGLGNTQITRLPESLSNLKNLEYLNIAIDVLDLEQAFHIIKTLPKLQTLTLTNQLDFPPSIAHLRSVKSLRVTQNYRLWHKGYEQLPLSENLSLLTNLEELDLSNNNQVTRLPETIGKLRNLRKLDISATGIHDFPHSLQFTCLELVEGMLNDDPNQSQGISSQNKEKIVRWFPHAKIWIW